MDVVKWVWKNWVAVVLSLLLLILVIVWGARSGSPDPAPSARPAASSTAGASGSTAGATTQAPDDLPTIAYDDLPREAKATLALIAKGGPYPYRQDGKTFQNRERLLPPGRYQEFTVVTPGEDDRGARRVIKERGGTLYYTGDHYKTFRRIQQ
ncbi:ribonuclease domain-containing protein [Luteipulveratus flavus]|uniref:Ribonuclease domain-containing protein n=1 Tax=Luteipulveratus flavus TaxID=3031728 RepID=A0ABT6C4V1_9MICO|nr:ribonuclease domain-containing protein [Luteipulveratus sp. YIM 133296]MDF8263079.1 ribonuclease domain-containing protein [Luteipulveratus sp. YIM 133296]